MTTKIRLQLRKASDKHKTFQMTVPKWIAEHLGWDGNTTLIVSLRGKFMRVCREGGKNV